ncbi:myxosortase-dependent M36 family metallopeptidase [Pyxidicoccus fallax]|uniref:myxosortase-dependent M36 family metallopeptidase n=1 Tax=Pyxidicoccus fallax TaxID=394095 RepID=UPI0031B5E616
MRRLVATLSGLALVLSGTGAAARSLPNYDALQDAKPSGRASAGFKSVNPVKGARVSHRDALTGSPTFIWVNKTAEQTKLRSQFASMAPEQAALAQVKDHAALFGLTSFEAAGAKVASVSRNRQGVKVVKLEQQAGGIEVFRQGVNLLLNRDNELVAVSGVLSNHVSTTKPEARLRFQLPATQAIAVAYKDLTGNTLDPSLLAKTKTAHDAGPYSHFTLATYARPLEQGLVIPARVKQVLFPLPGALVPAYYLEINTGAADSKDSDYFSYVVSATDGSLLMRKNLTEDAEFSYRVFADSTPPYTPHEGPGGNSVTPHPTGNPDGYRPPFVAPALVTLESAPFSQLDPWLPDGAEVTRGNNVDAFANITPPDGYNQGDIRPTVTAPGVFDRTMLFDIQPNANETQISAATTSLFFMNNWLHDWFYDSGFDEASGNAQVSNYGRGGLEGDAINAQAQDFDGTNNANMRTPSDGAAPRMRMYLFSGVRNARLTVTAPASIAGNYQVGVASGFGPQTFDVSGSVVAALDEANTAGPTTTDACTAFTNAAEVAGKLALVDRGGCNFTVKLENAQTAGAIGVIIADNAAGPVTDIGGTATNITLPSLRLTQEDGARLRGALAEGVTATLFRGPTIGLDGTVDNQIVAHEWGHYISNRLIGNAAGLVNNQGRAMGEGWGDFTALLMTVRAEDINVPSNANWSGVYAMAEYATRGISVDSSFYGIRRGAYSVDPTKNALRFRHIMDGVALPTDTTPIIPGGVNSQVHNSGEIWASMLWECYVSLLRAHPFQEAQDRMKSYVVNGYKMTPVAPTYTEARDAVLASALANDPADFQRLWAAFARRGMGVGAVAPDRYSTNHAGVVESYELGVDVELVEAKYADADPAAGDADGILDNGETGTILVSVFNKGSSPADATSATVVSTTPGVTVGNRGTVNFPAIPAGGTAEVSIPVSLRGAGFAQRVDLVVAIRDDGQVVPGDKSTTLSFKANYDEVPLATATETVEASDDNLPWENDADETLVVGTFEVIELEDLNRAFFGPNLGAAGDIRLVTPPLEVSSTEPLSLVFRHAYSFEFDPDGYYDGAVIEISEDGGQTWTDIGDSLYNGELFEYEGNLNPLAGHRAIVGATPGFPAFITSTLNLGTAYAGKTVQIRFRIVSDNGAAATGWVLDDLSFSGITNKPFTRICDDNGTCGNTAPVVNAGADVTVDERAQVSLTGTAFDVDGQTLTYAWARVSGPAVTLTGANTLTPSFTAPEVTANSTLVLRLTVSDGTVTSTDTVNVVIRQVNRAPTVNAGVDLIAVERSTVTLTGSASDADNNALTYLWTQTAGTPVALSGYNTATATFTAPETATGEMLTFRLAVSDGQTSGNDTVNVRIDNANRAPMVTASSVSVDERSTATLQATASDADGDNLTYAWTQLDGEPVTLEGADTATATFSTGNVSADAELRFRVSVSDGQASTTADVVVNVRDVNRAPTVNAGLDGTVAEGATATLSGSASDEDGDTLTYHWVQVSGTPVALSGANAATATFTAPATAGGETLIFALTVSDGKSTTSDTVSVVVNAANKAPVAKARIFTTGNQTAIILDGSESSDPDGDAITYKWQQTGGPSVSIANPNQAVLSVDVPEIDDAATFSFRLTVTDSEGATHSVDVQTSAKPDHGGGCSSTGAGAPAGMLGLALLSLLRRRRKLV